LKKIPLGKHRHGCENNIKTNLKWCQMVFFCLRTEAIGGFLLKRQRSFPSLTMGEGVSVLTEDLSHPHEELYSMVFVLSESRRKKIQIL
jgi:hypothetical protein